MYMQGRIRQSVFLSFYDFNIFLVDSRFDLIRVHMHCIHTVMSSLYYESVIDRERGGDFKIGVHPLSYNYYYSCINLTALLYYQYSCYY